jgi:hypothetical protein
MKFVGIFLGTQTSSANQTDSHNITDIVLKVFLSINNPPPFSLLDICLYLVFISVDILTIKVNIVVQSR